MPDERRLGAGWRLEGPTAHLEAGTGTFFLYLMDLGFHYRDIQLNLDFSGSMSAPLEINGRSFPGDVTKRSERWRYSVHVP